MSAQRIGRYTVLRSLGTGGMGEVFLAEDPDLGRRVAVKVLHADVAGSETNRLRFRNEARALAALNVPGIVTVHEIGEDGGREFIAMELVAGHDLREATAVGIPLGDLVAIAANAAEAMAEAHDAGVLHRDLKPENLMVTGKLAVKIIDFGLARNEGRAAAASGASSNGEVDSLTRPGAIMGTPAYMAPELVFGEPATSHADTWALGVTLYELIQGENPFEMDNAVKTFTRIIHADEPPPLSDVGTVPRPLSDLVQRMMDPTPEARPTMREVAKSLRSFAPDTRGIRVKSTVDGTASTELDLVPTEQPRGGLGRVALVVSTLVVAAGAAYWLTTLALDPEPEPESTPEAVTPTTAAPESPVVALPPFRVDIPDLAGGESDGASYVVATLLRGVPGLRVISSHDLWSAVAERGSGVPDWAFAAEGLGATHILSAEIERRGETFSGTARVVELSTEMEVATAEAESAELDGVLFDLASGLAPELLPGAQVRWENRHSLGGLDDYELGARALHDRNWSGAILHFERAVEEDPEFFEAWYHLALAGSWASVSREDTIEASERAAALAATPRDRAVMEALLAYMRSRYEEAMRLLEPIYEENPRDRDVAYVLAEGTYHSGRHVEGIALFRQVLRNAPGFTIAAIHPMNHAIAMRDEEAASGYEMLLRRDADEQTRHIAEIALAMGRYEAAAAEGMAIDVRVAALTLLGRDSEAEALLAESHDEGSLPRLLDGAARAFANGDEAAALSAAESAMRIARRDSSLPTLWNMRQLVSILVAVEALPALTALSELVAETVAAPVQWQLAVHTAAFSETGAIEGQDQMPLWYRRSAEAIRQERAGDYAAAAATWRELLEDPSEDGDFVEKLALRRVLLAAERAEEARVVCDELVRPARFRPVVIVARALCQR